MTTITICSDFGAPKIKSDLRSSQNPYLLRSSQWKVLDHCYSSLLLVSVSIMYILWLPQWVRGKESTCNAKDVAGAPVSIPGLGRSPGERNDNPFHGKPHRWKIPAGYSPWGPKSWTWFHSRTTKCIFYFPFSLSDSLYLKRVSCLQHIVESTLQ